MKFSTEQVTLLPFFCEVRFVSFLCSVMYIIVCPFSSTIRIQFFQLSMLVIDKAGIIKQKCLAMIGLKNCSLGIKQKQIASLINHSIKEKEQRLVGSESG
jgi:hypothetical protein